MDDFTKIPQLKKNKMGVWTVVFMLYCLCAAGAFGIEEMIPILGPGLTIVLLLLLPGIYGYPIGLMCAELGSVKPEEGGFYTWPRDALGEFWGFQAGWWRTFGVYIDNTLYVILAGEYLGAAFELSWPAIFAVKMSMILVFTVINLIGLKEVGSVSTVLAVIVLIGFTCVAVVGFANVNTNPMEPFFSGEGGVAAALGTGLAIGMWMYCGYESMSSVAEELEDPQVIPKALIIVVPLMAATYILPTIAGLASLGEGNWELWSTESGVDSISYANVLGEYLGRAGLVGFAFVAVIANLSIYNTYIASGSRGFFVLAQDKLGPPFLAKISKRGSPHVAIISMAIFNAVLCHFPFAVVVVLGMFVYMFSLGMVMVSGVRLRKQIPDRPKGIYKIPVSDNGLIAVAVVPCVIMIFALYTAGTDYFFAGVLVLLTGPFMYIWWKKKYGGLALIDPEKYPLDPKTGLGIIDSWHLSNVFFVTAIGCALARVILPLYEQDWDPLYDYDISGLIATEELYELEGAELIALEEELYPAAEALIGGLQNGILALAAVALILGLAFRMSYKKQKKAN